MNFDSFRVLSDDMPRKKYVPSAKGSLEAVVQKGLHYGQRKLLLSEVELLSHVYEAKLASKPLLVVYAGAAGGMHLPFLFELFPEVRFVLVDPAPFCDAVREMAAAGSAPIAELIEDYCSDELCVRLARQYGTDYDLVFVSDIRSGVPTSMQSNAEHTAMMETDNALQRGYCFALKPLVAMLKFHPPYPRVTDPASPRYDADDPTPESITYLDGVQLLGVWAPKSSSEVRLVVTGPFDSVAAVPTRAYSCVAHEERCYAYNTDGRYASDCRAERLIWEAYVRAFPACGETPETLSRKASAALGTPLLRPLDADFDEAAARLVTLLYSRRRPEFLELYDTLRGVITPASLTRLISEHREDETVPAGVTVGGVELPEVFWQLVADGNLPEAYSFPPVRLRFAKHFRKGGQGSAGRGGGGGHRQRGRGQQSRKRPRTD